MYGQNPRVEVTALLFPLDTLRNLSTEAELMSLYGHTSEQVLNEADAEDANMILTLSNYDSDEDIFAEIPWMMSDLRIQPPLGVDDHQDSELVHEDTGMFY